jgi:hypothetical protein
VTFRLAALVLLGTLASPSWGQDGTSHSVPVSPSPPASLDTGFRLMYELRFDDARAAILVWRQQHPNDAMGPTAEAASYLFEEFHRQGVLTSEFFLDDDKLLGGIEGRPDPKLRAGFFDALSRGERMAEAHLRKDRGDPAALYPLALQRGMLGNYRALIERKHLQGVRLTERAENLAIELLAIRPDLHDAWLAIGASNYIVGCIPAHKRFFLWFGGITGDRQKGMEQLERAAQHGSHLRPYAKILLALASLREKQHDRARRLLLELNREFPSHPIFARELARLGHPESLLSRP